MCRSEELTQRRNGAKKKTNYEQRGTTKDTKDAKTDGDKDPQMTQIYADKADDERTAQSVKICVICGYQFVSLSFTSVLCDFAPWREILLIQTRTCHRLVAE